ncbi:transmembrane and immunoglobulin domain-containing protein 1 [Protopterus annectens]|uniref:transmembrane and immunoglobulin domain-containing protein 1 n=1 Tax=Protopterus annectens TaxID=7888 RepID=UPI001CFA3483|nr:transmembrane and immunoglobulin domain-containing protein 1 [Protopterus annectens]
MKTAWVMLQMFCPCLLLLFISGVTGVEVAINGNRDHSWVLNTNISSFLSLWCEVQNNTKGEELIWYRGQRQVSLNPGNQINTSNICVSPITENENGITYTCLLKSNANINASVQLNVIYAPILTGRTEISIQEGDSVKMSCNVNANPQAQTAWHMGSASLTLQKGRYKVYQDSEVLQLSISKAEKSDAGNFSCVAESSAGKEIKIFDLQVKDKVSAFPFEPLIAGIVVVIITLVFGIVSRRKRIAKLCCKNRF